MPSPRFRPPIIAHDSIDGWLTPGRRKKLQRRQTRIPVYWGYGRGLGPYNVKRPAWAPAFRSDPAHKGGWDLTHRRRLRHLFRSATSRMARRYDLTNSDDLAALADLTENLGEAYRENEWYPFSCDPIHLRHVRRFRDRMAGREPEPPYRGLLYEALTAA